MLPQACASGKHQSLCYTGRRPAAQYFAAGGRKSGVMSDHKRKLALAAIVVAAATAVSRVTGLGREVITAAVYGVIPDYNTFVSVSVIPQLVQQLFADAAISAAFVPVFTSLLAKGERERAYRLAANLLGLIVVVVGAAVALLALAAGPLTSLLYPELTTTVTDAGLAAQLLRILVPTIVSIVWNLTIIVAIIVFQDSLGTPSESWKTMIATMIVRFQTIETTAGIVNRSSEYRTPLRAPASERKRMVGTRMRRSCAASPASVTVVVSSG